MRTSRMVANLLALVAAIVLVAPTMAQRPNPHATPDADSATPAVVDCSAIQGYVGAVNEAFNSADAFIAFVVDEDVTWGMPEAEAEEVIASGDAFLAELEALTPPVGYEDAHEAIMFIMRVNVEVAHFYAFDSSIVPDVNGQVDAWATVDEGERALASACPEEVEAIGGYVVFEPAPLPDDIENMPE